MSLISQCLFVNNGRNHTQNRKTEPPEMEIMDAITIHIIIASLSTVFLSTAFLDLCFLQSDPLILSDLN